MPFMTGDTIPSNFRCKVIRIPDDLAFLDALNGALLELTYPHNFEQEGNTLTPDEMAEVFSVAYDDYTTEECMQIPIGLMSPHGAATAPDKWLVCNGASVLRSDYPELFTVIGTTYGAADATHFNLPDMRDRSPMMPGSGTVTAIGQQAGAGAHILTISQMPAHAHDFLDPGHVHTLTDPGHVHTLTDPGHTHNQDVGGTDAYLATGGTGRTGYGAVTTSNTTRVVTDSNTTGASVASAGTGASVASHSSDITFHSQGSNAPHPNIHPVLGVNFIIYAGR